MSAAREDRGQALVLMALALATLLLGVGLAVDTGRLLLARRTMQAAADAGAWAAGVALQTGATATAARDAAVLDVQRNGYTTGGTVTVTVNVPPLSGDRAGDASFAEVIVTDAVTPVFFTGARSVTARAVGGVATAGTFNEGLLALASTGVGVTVGGTGTKTVTGGIVQANSAAPGAISLSGSASLAADAIRAVGTAVDASSGSFTPAPTAGAAARPDPFAGLAGPSTAGLTSRADPLATTGSVTISPGIYPSITISNRANLTMNPGTYVVRGPISIAGTGRLTGTGVHIYTTYANYPAAFVPGTPCGAVSITTDLALTAPTSGAQYGMLLFHDRSCTTAVTLQGNGGATKTSLTGTVYAPAAALTFGAVSSATTVTTQVVAATISLPAGVLVIDIRDRSALARPGLPSVVE